MVRSVLGGDRPLDVHSGYARQGRASDRVALTRAGPCRERLIYTPAILRHCTKVILPPDVRLEQQDRPLTVGELAAKGYI